MLVHVCKSSFDEYFLSTDAVISKPRDVRKLKITFNGTIEGVNVHGSQAILLSCLEYQDTVLIRSAENRSCCIHVVLKLKYLAGDLGR